MAAACAPGVAATAAAPDPAPAKMTGEDVPQVPTRKRPVEVVPPKPDTPVFEPPVGLDELSPKP